MSRAAAPEPHEDAVGPALEITDLTVRYRDTVALDRVTLTLDAGTVCGLVGVNGSGKSTLLKAVVGMVRPVSGQVRVLGSTPDRARRTGAVAYVPQNESVDWDFPIDVHDVVMTGRYGRMGVTRRASARDHAAVAEAIDRVGLTDLARRPIGALSGGQRKRAFVARGIAQEARVLLLDEPFGGVDKPSEATITALLRELAAQGRTVLVSTHDLHGLAGLCTEAVLLQRTVLAHGPTAEVLSPDRIVRAFGLDLRDLDEAG